MSKLAIHLLKMSWVIQAFVLLARATGMDGTLAKPCGYFALPITNRFCLSEPSMFEQISTVTAVFVALSLCICWSWLQVSSLAAVYEKSLLICVVYVIAKLRRDPIEVFVNPLPTVNGRSLANYYLMILCDTVSLLEPLQPLVSCFEVVMTKSDSQIPGLRQLVIMGPLSGMFFARTSIMQFPHRHKWHIGLFSGPRCQCCRREWH